MTARARALRRGRASAPAATATAARTSSCPGRAGSRAPSAALFALGALLSAVTIWWEIGPHDEGLMLQAAHRIASGELPYRDFWWNYAPGQPLVLALPDRLVGPSLVPWRVLRVALDATVAVLAYLLVRRETGGRWPPLLAWLAVAGAMAFPTGPGPNPAALALGLGALLAAPRRPALAGGLAGLAAFFRLEIGVAVALGAALLAGRRAAAGREAMGAVGGPPGAGEVGPEDREAMGADGGPPGAGEVRCEDRPWRSAARCLGAGAAVALAAWAPFVLAAPREALDQTLGFLRIQHLQRLPFPLDPSGAGLDPNKLLELWMPAILVAACAAWAAHALARRPPLPALAAAPLAAVGLAYLLGRTDEFHLVPLAVALPLLLAGAAAREPRRAVAAGLVALLGLIVVHGVERKVAQLAGRPALEPVPGPAGDGVRTAAGEAAELRGVLAAIGGRSLFVVPPRLDRVTVGNPLLYVLAGQENPTRYDVIQPGVVTTEAVQREMIDDLERVRPAVLVRWVDPRTAPEDNGSGRERGARLLDAYLARTYGPGERIGAYVVAERR